MHTPAIPRRSQLHALVLLMLLSCPLQAGDPFRVQSKPPTGGYITQSSKPIETVFIDNRMLRELGGYLGQLNTRDFVALRRGLGNPSLESVATEPMAYIHMSRKGLDDSLAEVHQASDGSYLVRNITDEGKFFTIDAQVIESRITLPIDNPQFPADTTELDRRFELAPPHTGSPITLTTKVVRSRIRANYPRLSRTLGQETMQARFPQGFDPDTPLGVLIWISPSESGSPPRIFEAICDELGLICVGVDNNGNTRPLTDRLQNHLDSIATLDARFRIDHQRIYLTGMSGGGRCSGILQCSFPEIFAGAVPIVGLDTYHNAPTGKEGKYWPARLGKPSAKWFKLLKQRRIAAITGTADFNEPEMIVRRDLMKRDKLQIKLIDIEGMGHTMPTSEQFADALRWVDEPQRETLEGKLLEAQGLLDTFKQNYLDPDPADPEQRSELIEITAAAPWSAPAWEAARLLGFE